MPGPQLFAVISWGATATHWLARVLNAHPHVLCLHHHRDALGQACGVQVDPGSYVRMLEISGQSYDLVGDCHGVSPYETPHEAFDAMPRWQQSVFRGLLSSDARRAYQELGYDLSFL